jgi:hypothetical protein
MRSEDGPELVAVINAESTDNQKVLFRNLHSRCETWRYSSIVWTLEFHGASRMDAEETALWICRHAKAGDRKVIDPGILIVIEEKKHDV